MKKVLVKKRAYTRLYGKNKDQGETVAVLRDIPLYVLERSVIDKRGREEGRGGGVDLTYV